MSSLSHLIFKGENVITIFHILIEIFSDSGSKKLEIDIAKPDNEQCGDFYILLRDYG